MRFLLLATLLPLPALAAAPSLDRLASLPVVRLPAAEVRSAVEQHKTEPLRFAVAQTLALDQRSGSWDQAAPGVSRWRLRVASEGASSLSLHLRGVQLPAGAQLWLSGAEGGDVQGPFDAAAVRDGELWLPIVRASEAVLEVQLPTDAQPSLRLAVAEAFHGYRRFSELAGKAGPSGDESDSCNIDVACAAGDNWRPEIRSALYLVTSGVSLCTGTLMNNTRLDNRALVLTANHCGIRSSNVASLTAYFNLQSSSCSSNSTGRVDQNMAGGSFLAGTSTLPDNDVDTDFTLITLNGGVPASFSALYAGWDARSGTAPQSGVAIHHPQGDEKKIAVYSAAATQADNQTVESFVVDAWQVRWSQGTTESGSSGSALWNQSHRVVGMLSGGNASCRSPTAPDLFARLDRAWTAGGASTGQLKAHLDPTNSGSLTLNSKEQGGSGTLPDNSGGVGGEGGGAFGGLLLLLPALLRRRRAKVSWP